MLNNNNNTTNHRIIFTDDNTLQLFSLKHHSWLFVY